MKKHLLLTSCFISALTMSGWEYPTEDNPQIATEFYSHGLGTQEEPYVITTPQQFANFSYLVNNGSDFSGKYIELGNDITLNAPETESKTAWTSIGTEEKPFKGNFDGKGHKVTGLFINSITTARTYYSYTASSGLFGTAKNSDISNISLEGLDIDLKFSKEEYPDLDYLNAGGIVGNLSNGSLTSCKVSGSVNVSVDENFNEIMGTFGGVVGKIDTGKLLADCLFDGSISVSDSNSQGTIYSGIGGIGGVINADDAHDLTNNGNIECHNGGLHAGGIAAGLYLESGMTKATNLVNNGNVTTDKGSSAGIAYWLNCGAVEDCLNSGDITHKDERASSYGMTSDAHFTSAIRCTNKGKVDGPGLIGYGDFLSRMEDCVNYADVDGAGLLSEIGVNDVTFLRCSNHGNVGIAGIVGGNYMGERTITMEDCHNYGDVKGRAGLYGFGYSVILKSCTNTGNIIGTNSFRDENIMGYQPSYASKVGGLIGRAAVANVENCDNSGEITGPHISGGLIGAVENEATIRNSKNSGKVSSIYNPDIKVEFYCNPKAGGIIGSAYTGSEISDCENTGEVVMDNKRVNTYSIVGIGGIVGEYSGTITKSHNTADIISNIDKDPDSYFKSYAGGLVGRAYKISVSTSYNTGNITGNADIASGLVAYKEGYAHSGIDSGLEDCYAACNVETSDGKSVGLISLGEELPIKSSFSYSSLKGSETYAIGDITSSISQDVEATYYLSTPGSAFDEAQSNRVSLNAEAASSEIFASGSICVALNHGRTTDAPWGQTLNVDSYPLLNGAGDPEDVGGINDLTVDETICGWSICTPDGITVVKNICGTLEDVTSGLEKGLYILVSTTGRSVKIVK